MIHCSSLENGVRILVEPIGHVQSAAIGLWCKTGSKDELDREAGITHLIEHMLFKGTGRRSAKQIAEEIEGRGGSLNAFTDKEQTCYYCRVLSDDVETGIDVLADMLTGSLLDADELSREIGVVLEEIKRGEDEPDSHVHDLHLSARWGEHPLGKPIIGTRDSVSVFKRNNLAEYIERRYLGSHIILSVAGNVEAQRVAALASEKLGGIAPGTEINKPERPIGKTSKLEQSKDVEVVHFCIGTDGASVYDSDYYTGIVLDGILGGGMSSRLFQEIREKRGLAYAIGSYTLSYTAGGAFTVYGGTSYEKWDEVQSIVRDEFDKVMKEGVPDDELRRTKQLLSGHIVLALEGMSARMMRMAKNEIIHGRDVPVSETLAKIEAVTNEAIIEFARKFLPDDQINTTAIGPF